MFRPADAGWWSRRADLPPDSPPGTLLGEADGTPVWALEVRPADGTWTALRTLMAQGEPDQVKAAVRAAELASWAAQNRFCGSCGTPTVRNPLQTVFECPGCQAQFWPRVSPAVIMLVHRGDEVLLARHAAHSRPGAVPIHTTLAGFVEAGETLEEAVAREVAEETAVVVGTPQYIGSQPWPFPHSLMVGFHVPWVSGEPVPDGEEVLEARWYRRDTLPEIPPPPTIARRLIESFFSRRP